MSVDPYEHKLNAIRTDPELWTMVALGRASMLPTMPTAKRTEIGAADVAQMANEAESTSEEAA